MASEHEDIEMIDAFPEWKVPVLDEIDPDMAECKPQTTPVEEIEKFLIDLGIPPKC